jgi:hypothetical protein
MQTGGVGDTWRRGHCRVSNWTSFKLRYWLSESIMTKFNLFTMLTRDYFQQLLKSETSDREFASRSAS